MENFTQLEILELESKKDSFTLLEPNFDENYPYIASENDLSYEVFMIEIESKFPPTECVLTIKYATQTDRGRYDTVTIHLFKYRRSFLYENGIYILYLEDTKEL